MVVFQGFGLFPALEQVVLALLWPGARARIALCHDQRPAAL